MTLPRLLPAAALAAGLLLAAGGTAAQQPRLKLVQPPTKLTPLPTQPPPKLTPLPTQPIDPLPIVPRSAGAFISVKVSAVMDHPDVKPVVEQLRKTPEAFDGVMEMVGVPPHEMDRVTLFWPAVSQHGPGEPVLVVTTREPFNEARVLKALRAEPVFEGDLDGGRGGVGAADAERRARDAAEQNLRKAAEAVKEYEKAAKIAPPVPKGGDAPPPFPPVPKEPPKLPEPNPGDDPDGGVPISTAAPAEPLFYTVRSGGFDWLFLADERTLVFVAGGRSDSATVALLAQLIQRKQTGPLADAIADSGNHTVAAGLYLPPLFRDLDRRMPPELAPYAALTAARTATLTGDLTRTGKATLRLNFDDAAAARRAAPVLEEGLKTLSDLARTKAAAMKERRSAERAIAPLLEAGAAGWGKAAVRADGATVTAVAEIEVGPAAATALGELLQSLTSRKKFAARTNNLKQIGIALHSYFDANGRLPANVYGPKGEPLLSWRVHLLPYLEQADLYRQFKMDEPWDGPNNKKLAERMPKVFEVAGRDAPKGQTYYQAFLTPDPRKAQPKGYVGRTWLIEGENRGTNLVAVPDGTSNTIAIVEARDAVVWSKPDDLPFGGKLPPLGEARADRFMALMLDGSVRALPTDINPDVLRILIDGQDGMVTPDLDDDRPRGFPFRPGGSAASLGKAAAEDFPPDVSKPPAEKK